MPGEHMVLHSHPHWWYFWKQVLGGVGVIVGLILTIWASGTLSTILLWLTIAGFVAWLAATAYQFVQWQTTQFAVTDQRVAYQSGFFRRSGVSIPLNRVNNVNFQQSFVARLLDNGIVVIESAGETGDSVFENIPKPDEVRNTIFQQMKAYDTADSDRDAAAIARAMQDGPSGAPAGPSIEERLRELDQLRDSGVINDEEYQRKREQILGSL